MTMSIYKMIKFLKPPVINVLAVVVCMVALVISLAQAKGFAAIMAVLIVMNACVVVIHILNKKPNYLTKDTNDERR